MKPTHVGLKPVCQAARSIFPEGAIWLFLLFSPVGSAAQSGDFTYEVTQSTITITKYTGAGSTVVVPATIDGLAVTAIGTNAFYNSTGLTNITLPDGLTIIGASAFDGCTGLAGVTFPNNLTTIGDEAFAHCTGLTSLTWPPSVTTIGSFAFLRCSGLTTLSLPPTVTVGNGAFLFCTGLVDVTINTTAIPPTFAYQPNLKTLTIGNNVSTIPDGSFEYCTGLTNVTIGSHVSTIGSYAFYSCVGLTSVKLPRKLTGLWHFAFGGCTELTAMYFAGDAPKDEGIEVFGGAGKATIYYLAGARGWNSTFGGRPAVVWQPSYSQWAELFGLATEFPSACREQDDADQDGLTNTQEMTVGTDPTNPQSVLVFEALVRPANLSEDDRTAIDPSEFALYFQSSPGKSYQIESTEVLGGAWTTVASATATTTQKRVRLTRPAGQRFYRVVIR